MADVMSVDPITVKAKEEARKAAILMEKYGIGCVIVVNEQGKPIGIVTERDLISRVMAKGLNGDEVTCREVMSSPLLTVDPKTPLVDAMSKMSKFKVRRLVVIERGRLLGIVTDRDILRVAPALIEILASKEAGEEKYVKETQVGQCEICGEWSEDLREVNGHFLCEECRSEYSTQA
ncbi:MAG: hypothetical protein DRJ68_03085 [Thermoprotei archaeon]|nr:MAG: hypothetical protein DRJ68_03085 [Thermoprotei archaeon]